MRSFVHISDLHFGRTRPELIASLEARIQLLRPDYLVVTGDLTQRAKPEQFVEARALLERFSMPVFVVPGNHDVPLYNVLRRIFAPLATYRKLIPYPVESKFFDEELSFCGINTTRSFTVEDGVVRRSSLRHVQSAFREAGERVKILFCHHPLDPNGDLNRDRYVKATGLENLKIDFILSGHLHQSRIVESVHTDRGTGQAWTTLMIHAGTAVSTRMRGESNAFNEIIVDRGQVEIRAYLHNADTKDFQLEKTSRFERGLNGWKPIRQR